MKLDLATTTLIDLRPLVEVAAGKAAERNITAFNPDRWILELWDALRWTYKRGLRHMLVCQSVWVELTDSGTGGPEFTK